MSNCEKCIFGSTYKDHGASIPVCTREKEFSDAIKAYGREDCPYHFTKEDLIQVQDCNLQSKAFDSLIYVYDSFYQHLVNHYDELRNEKIADLSIEFTKIYLDLVCGDLNSEE